jgi:hypothetical protein
VFSVLRFTDSVYPFGIFKLLAEIRILNIARQIKSLFRQNRSLCGTSIKVGMGTRLRVFV